MGHAGLRLKNWLLTSGQTDHSNTHGAVLKFRARNLQKRYGPELATLSNGGGSVELQGRKMASRRVL
jgi:hypothetical protein